ncbi:sterile alpha motif domain-containing protein 3-like [Pseudorasbora parva]|uniref:sterile alpha motif domain-containing protein 3-like n=1 Tax=Pseudorasbora parva TaxID=51549 RepID=UPI00351E7BFE
MYPNLRDQTGIGYESWHGMLRNKFKKERKPLVDLNLINVPGQYMRKGRKRSLDENENDTASIADMTTEDEFSIRQHISKMNTQCEKKKPNISMLQDKMKRTERDRDVYIKEKSTQEVLIKYPALRLPAIIFSEMKTKYNTDVDRRILTGFGTTAEKIVTEAQRRGVAKDLLAMYNTALQSHAEEAHKGLMVIAGILVLPYLLHDDPAGLYVINKPQQNLTPTMVITGNPFGESSIAVFLDGEELFADEPDDITMGVGLTISAYFLFNIQYNKPIKNTLTFLQHLLGIQKESIKLPIIVLRLINYLKCQV